jgi:hypothetical protein
MTLYLLLILTPTVKKVTVVYDLVRFLHRRKLKAESSNTPLVLEGHKEEGMVHHRPSS